MNYQEVIPPELYRRVKESTQLVYEKYLEKLMENPEDTKFLIEIHVGYTKYRIFIDKKKDCVGVIYMFDSRLCGVIVFDNDIEKQIELAIYMNYVNVMFDCAVITKDLPLPFLVMRRYTTGESIYSFVLQSELNKLNSVHHYFLTYDEAWTDFKKTLN